MDARQRRSESALSELHERVGSLPPSYCKIISYSL